MSTYSNGWGHLIVTIAVMAMATALFLTKSLDPPAIIALVSPVITFWFMSGAINRFSGPPSSTPIGGNTDVPTQSSGSHS